MLFKKRTLANEFPVDPALQLDAEQAGSSGVDMCSPELAGQTSPEFNEAFAFAARDKSVRNAMELVQAERLALLAMHDGQEFERAVRLSMAGVSTVAEVLRERVSELRSVRENILAERRKQRAADIRHQIAAGPAIRHAIESLYGAQEDVRRLRRAIESFDAARAGWLARLRDSGLSDADIESLGDARPTRNDLERWRHELDTAIAREAELTAVIRCGAAGVAAINRTNADEAVDGN